MPSAANTAANTAAQAAVNTRVPITQEELHATDPIAEVHDQIASRLHGPGAGRVSGHTGQMHPTCVVFDHDQRVDALQEQRVDVQEVQGKDALAYAVRNCAQVGPDRCGAGSMPAW